MANTPDTADLPDTHRRTVGRYTRYADAERAVDHLADRGFPVEHLAIVGYDMRMTEQVTGKVTTLGYAGRGAASGAVTGGFLALLFGLFNWTSPLMADLLLALYGLLLGAVIGAVFALLANAALRGGRDFESTSTVEPSRYEVVADHDQADRALELLSARQG